MRDPKNWGGGPPQKGRRGPPKSEACRVAEAAGMSRHQIRQALAIASIPEEEFERLVESDKPPTPTRLAEIGRGYAPRKRGRRLTCCPHCGGDLTTGKG